MDNNIRLIVIDSFCGAGGVTEGFHRATIDGQKIAKVVIGINHDAMAIESHKENHPDTFHFVEDFTTLDPNKLVDIISNAKLQYPNAKVLFWASAECTHHSKAKGGLPRDADSRSLPEHIERYVKVIHPDIIGVENVVEFLDWGPLNENGKPIKELKGIYYKAWRDNLMELGYHYEYAILNAANFGAYTSRIRYFGIFAKDQSNIAFPKPTHSKNGENLAKKWKSVKDVLDLNIEGESIFNRKKPLVDATLERIMNGIVRFVIGSSIKDFMIKYNAMNQNGKYKIKNTDDNHQMITAYYGNGYNISIEEPCGTVTTNDRFALVTSKFIANQFSGGGQLNSIEEPSSTIMTTPKQNIVSCAFLDQQYGCSNPARIEQPAATLTANPKLNLVNAQWLMDTQFSNIGNDLDNPCPTITANRKHFYLMNPQFNNNGGSIEKPCFTLIARMDKMPPYLVETVKGEIHIRINESDSETMKKLKHICNDYRIIDVRMRMLMIKELLRIQGFGDKYKLKGTKAEMKKFIGNAVECTQAKVLAEAIAKTI